MKRTTRRRFWGLCWWLPAVALTACTVAPGDGEATGSAEAASAGAVDTPVRLELASSYWSGHYGIAAIERSYVIRLADLAYDKQVVVHHSPAAGGPWIDVPAHYLGPADPGYELWEATTAWNAFNGGEYPFGEHFVVRYEAAGETYWDNNEGHDYWMGDHTGPMLGNGIHVRLDEVHLYRDEWANESVLYGNVDVRSLAYDKVVRIVYTTDDWATVRAADGAFVNAYHVAYSSPISCPNVFGTERWSFHARLGTVAAQVKLAVAYEVDGQTYWDNNYGRDYTVHSTN